MRRTILFALSLCTPLLFFACSGGQSGQANAPATATPAATPAVAQATPPAVQPQIVTAAVEEAKLTAGGAGQAVVRLDIADGYHVNANPPSDKFYIGTELQAEPQEGIAPGKPVYPQAVKRKFEFADQPLAVYEGQAVIKLPLRAEQSASKGRHTFRTRIRVQPCNDHECLQPRTIEAFIPLTIN
jgi:hypothetical protein